MQAYGNPRLLLVEDYRLLALAESRVLRRNGFEVLLASTGEESIDIAAGAELDLVVMDIDLGPGMDGIAAAQAIRERREVPVVFLSSHAEPEVRRRAQGVRLSSFVVKDSGEAALVAAVRSALASGQERGETA